MLGSSLPLEGWFLPGTKYQPRPGTSGVLGTRYQPLVGRLREGQGGVVSGMKLEPWA